tara:strand:+ start:335 stop:742 length:408 start_codon:yes stop_codon:yes gene_type:complete
MHISKRIILTTLLSLSTLHGVAQSTTSIKSYAIINQHDEDVSLEVSTPTEANETHFTAWNKVKILVPKATNEQPSITKGSFPMIKDDSWIQFIKVKACIGSACSINIMRSSSFNNEILSCRIDDTPSIRCKLVDQ